MLQTIRALYDQGRFEYAYWLVDNPLKNYPTHAQPRREHRDELRHQVVCDGDANDRICSAESWCPLLPPV